VLTSAPLLLHWTKESSVGISRFNEQHKRLYLLVEKLYQNLQNPGERTLLGELLGELYAYSVSHMTDEEDVLEYFNFPELQSHKNEHREFKKRIREYMDDFDSGNTAIATSIFAFLQEWLSGHMLGTDRHYTHFLHRRGVE
jgi:hemerythrin